MRTCVARHNKPVTSSHGHLCDHHYQATQKQIHDIHHTLTLLPYFIEPGSTPDTNNVRGRNIDPPAPIRLEILSLLDHRTRQRTPHDPPSATGLFHAWATWVRHERQLPQRATTISADLGTLHTHLEWIAGTDRIVELLDDLRIVHRALQAAIGDQAPNRVGTCPITTDNGSCGGHLYQDRYTALSVTCAKCGERWGENELRRLGLILTASTA